MAECLSPVVAGAEGEQDESALLLANALKKMDGLIGDFRPASRDEGAPVMLKDDPTVLKMIDLCEQLHDVIVEWSDKMAAKSEHIDEEASTAVAMEIPHPRVCISPHIQETILEWMGGVTVAKCQRAVQDKEELLAQVVSLQRQLETSQSGSSKLAGKVVELERVCMQRDQEVRAMEDEVKATKITLSTKEVELRHLKDQMQAGYRSEHVGGVKQVSFAGLTPPEVGGIHRRSFRRSLRKAFGFKGQTSSKTQDQQANGSQPLTNPRAVAFYGQTVENVCDWFSSIGLAMYSDLVQDKHVTGEKLAEMIKEPSNQHLVQLGVLSSLHCKKLRLAVEAALSEDSLPQLDVLDHEWVGKWVESLGLPQYKQLLLDARLDGRMLNAITVQDLQLLDVTTPYHIASIKRGLEALRLCNYDNQHMCADSNRSTSGCQKLLQWSASDVAQWLCSIDLEQYVPALDRKGIHGPVMYLDVHFTSESLAKTLGISATKTVLCKHLTRKFMELIGPVAAQEKVDAMQSKNFVALDPTELPQVRPRSRSVTGRRGNRKSSSDTPLLPVTNSPLPTGPIARCPSPM